MSEKEQDFCTDCESRRGLLKKLTATGFVVGLASVFGADKIIRRALDDEGLRSMTNAELDYYMKHPEEAPLDYPDIVQAVKDGNREYIRANVHVKPNEPGAVEAACLPGGCYTQTQCRCGSCAPYGRTFTRRVCCAGCGCGWLYYAWLAGSCGCSNPNC